MGYCLATPGVVCVPVVCGGFGASVFGWNFGLGGYAVLFRGFGMLVGTSVLIDVLVVLVGVGIPVGVGVWCDVLFDCGVGFLCCGFV